MWLVSGKPQGLTNDLFVRPCPDRGLVMLLSGPSQDQPMVLASPLHFLGTILACLLSKIVPGPDFVLVTSAKKQKAEETLLPNTEPLDAPPLCKTPSNLVHQWH